jgi:hypothetical protein
MASHTKALMQSKLAFVGCLILTVIVVHTCVRIEVLNARYGYYLPRTDFGNGNQKWRVAGRRATMRWLEHKIHMERCAAYAAAHPDDPMDDLERFCGPPYSADEQKMIDTELAENELRAELWSWVASMGILQYILAPLTFAWAVALAVCNRSHLIRMSAIGFAVAAAVSIVLMFHRAYFTSMGW